MNVTNPAESNLETGRKPSPRNKASMPSREDVRARLHGAADFSGEMQAVMDEVRAAGSEAVASNDASMRAVFDMANQYFAVLEKQLEKPNLTSDEENSIRDRMMQILEHLEAKDTENKAFLERGAQARMKVAVVGLGVLSLAAAGAVAGPEGLKQLMRALPEAARKTIDP